MNKNTGKKKREKNTGKKLGSLSQNKKNLNFPLLFNEQK